MNKIKFDDPAVKVYPGQIDKAISILRKRLEKSGVFRILGERKRNPSPSARERFKRRKATRRFMKRKAGVK